MKPDVTSEQMSAIEHQLRAMPEVKRVRFVSKDAAYAEFKKLFANSPDMVETVTADNLPPSFRVVPKAAEQVESIGEPFRNRPGVYRVVYAEKQVKTLLKVTRALQLGILVIALVLLVSASVLILNTIRMAIFARRREVAVMKLVGATNWFIRVPFMFEGLLQGLVGAGVAFAAVYLGRHGDAALVHLPLPHHPDRRRPAAAAPDRHPDRDAAVAGGRRVGRGGPAPRPARRQRRAPARPERQDRRDRRPDRAGPAAARHGP